MGNSFGAPAARPKWLGNTVLPVGHILTATPCMPHVWGRARVLQLSGAASERRIVRPYATLHAMLGVTLTACGLVTATFGTWRGYANARDALVSLARDEEPTWVAIGASRPFLARTRVRRFVRPVVVAMPWLAIAMYGLLMVSLGGTAA